MRICITFYSELFLRLNGMWFLDIQTIFHGIGINFQENAVQHRPVAFQFIYFLRHHPYEVLFFFGSVELSELVYGVEQVIGNVIIGP